MREILFRGKRTDNGEWAYGSPVFQDGYVLIRFWNGEEFEFEEYLVSPETISEFSGFTDKNGKKIFEGDIVKHYNNSDDGFDIGALYWDETFSQWKRTSIGNFHHRSFTYSMSRSCEYKVIGNIHDNPELLKGGEG